MSAAELPLRPLELLEQLAGHSVRFVVIGGFSLAAHGVVRGTKDVDLVPDPAPDNLSRLAEALRALDAERLEAAGFNPEEFDLQPDAEGLALGGNWALRTRYGRLDLMQDFPGLVSYERLRERAVSQELEGVSEALSFAGLDDLIRLKLTAGRDQDLIDVADLERARGAGR